MNRKTSKMLKFFMPIPAFLAAFLPFAAKADRHWTGGGETTDWTDASNWGEGNGSGNWVFGGNQIGSYPSVTDPVVVTFSNLVEIAETVWIQNENKPDVVWKISEGAVEGAGLKSSSGTKNVLNIGASQHGGLTIESGVYYMPKELWIGNGAANSYFTINGGVFTNNSYTCVGYGAYDRTATMTVNEGEFYQVGDKFIVGQGNHSGCIGVYEQTGGKVSVPVLWMSENNGSSRIRMTGGLLASRGNVSIGMKGEGLLEISAGHMTASGEFWVGGEGNQSSGNNGNGRVVMTGGSITNANWTSIGRNGTGILELKDGTFEITNNGFEIARYANSTGIVVVTGGTLRKSSNNQYCAVGFDGDYGALIVSNGTVSIKGQIQVAKGSGHDGHVAIVGGELSSTDLLQVGLNGNGSFEMEGGIVTCSGFRLGTDNANAVGTAKITGGTLVSTAEVYVGNGGTGTLNLNGGVIEANKFIVGSGSGTLVLNGGVVKARQNENTEFIRNSGSLAVKIGEGGAIFDTAGYNVAIPATLGNANGLVGNGSITKKGLGTLTISSNLDMKRTFTFEVEDDVGPIALTGTETLADGKVNVVIDPKQDGVVEKEYTLFTNLDEGFDEDDFDVTGPDMYAYSWKVEGNSLKVTFGFTDEHSVWARWAKDSGDSDYGWRVYGVSTNRNDKPIADYTTYVFTGAVGEPEFAPIAATHRTLLEATRSGDYGVTNTVPISSAVTTGKKVSVYTDEGCAIRLSGSGDSASLSATEFINNGTLIISGTVELDVSLDGGNVFIEEGARLNLVKPQTIGANISGPGTLALAGGTFSYREHNTNYSVLDNFAGTLVLCEGATLNAIFDNRANMNILLGSAKVRMEGATINGPNDNNSHFLNHIELAGGITNHVYGYGGNLVFRGGISGDGYLRADVNNRSVKMEGDNTAYEGAAVLEGPYIVFNGGNSASSNAVYTLRFNRANSGDGITEIIGNNQTFRFGVLRQLQMGKTFKVSATGSTIEIGAKSGGESVIEGQFTNNPLTLKKVGADSWLTLGTNFAMVAGSTLNVTSGGLALNLPEGETLPDLTKDTVTIDSSVTVRVNMTSEQRANLNLQRRHLLAKLPADFDASLKVGCEIAVDGIVQHDDPHLSSWAIRFRRVAQSGDDPAYVEMSLVKLGGLIIMFQ